MRKLRSENGFARIPIIFRPSERASNKAAFDSAGLAPLEMLWQITHPGLESGALCDEDEQLTDSFVVVEHRSRRCSAIGSCPVGIVMDRQARAATG